MTKATAEASRAQLAETNALLEARIKQQAVVAELGEFALRSGDWTGLLDRAVDALAQTLDVECCKVLELLPGGQELLLRAGTGWSEGLVGKATVDSGPDSQAGYTLASDRPVVVQDLANEERFSGPPLLREHGIVSGISVVILGRTQPFGVVGVHTSRRRNFSPYDVHFVQAVANVLAAAIARRQSEADLQRAHDELEERVGLRTAALARANRDLERQTRRLQLRHSIDEAILQGDSLPEIVQNFVQRVRSVLPLSGAGLVLFDRQNGQARWFADGGEGTPLVRELSLSELHALPAQQEADYDESVSAAMMSAVTGQAGPSSIVIPLRNDNQLAGILYLQPSEDGGWAPEYRKIADELAGTLAVAVVHVQLDERVRTSQAELQRLTRALVELQENERRSIALELHDTAGQSLASLMLGLGMVARDPALPDHLRRRVENLKETTNDVMELLHDLAVDLRPAGLDQAGLIPTLRHYATGLQKRHSLQIEFEAVGFEARRLPPEIETAAYRIVQEALLNVVRHAEARRASVVLIWLDNRLSVVIEDNGRGFDPGSLRGRANVGLAGMRERAEMLGGTLNVESRPGQGTTVYAELPAP